MEKTNYIPQRGVDFDDFIGTSYLKKSLKMSAPQLVPVYCPANDKHSDAFIGVRVQGYADSDQGMKQISRIMFPTRNFTEEDLNRLFVKTELEDGTVRYSAAENFSFDEVYVRVCYKTPGKPNPDEDNLKWVAAIDGGEVIALHGDKRRYVAE